MKSESPVLWCAIFIPYYIGTEFVPAIMFALVMEKYGEVANRAAAA